MCLQVLPLIASAAGAGLQSKSQNDALAAQSREVARGQREQMSLRDRASQRVNEQIQSLAKSDPRAEEAQAESDFTAALKRAKLARGGADLEGRAGGARFRDDLGLARTQAETEGKTLAQQLARIDAPQFQRFREGVNTSNAATDLSILNDSSRARDFLTRLRAGMRGPNPLVSGLGQGLTAYGMASSGRAGEPRMGAPPAVNGNDFTFLRGTTPYSNGDVFNAFMRNGG